MTEEAATYLSSEYVDIREQVRRVHDLISFVCARLHGAVTLANTSDISLL